MQKLRQGEEFQTSFCFLKKFYMWSKQVVSFLAYILLDVDKDL